MNTNQNIFSGRLLVFITIILAVIAGGVFLYAQDRSNVREFAGNIDRMEANTIFATGVFLKNGMPIPGKEDEMVEVEILVDPTTKLTKLAIKIPKGVDFFNVEDLEKEESATDLEAITTDSTEHVVGIEAVLEISSGNKFIGRTLYFRVPVFDTQLEEEIEVE